MSNFHFKNEVFVSEVDKQQLVSLITDVNKILDKYPYSTDFTCNTVTTMSRAKSHAKDTETWINMLVLND